MISTGVLGAGFYPVNENPQVQVSAENYQPQFRSLRNLKALYINLDPIRGFYNRLRAGKPDVLIKELRTRVEAAGLVWLTKDSVEREPGQPTLNFFPSYKPGCCTLGLWSGFSQGASVLTVPDANFRLSSWGSGANHYGGEKGATCLDPTEWAYDNIIGKLEAFIADYQRSLEAEPVDEPTPTPASMNCSSSPLLFVEMFDTGSSILGVDQKQILNELANTIGACKEFNYRIEAHADQRGPADYNLALSQARARTIKTYLIASGIASQRFESRALGEAHPVTSGTTQEDLAANRRVVITPVRNASLGASNPPPSVYRMLSLKNAANSRSEETEEHQVTVE